MTNWSIIVTMDIPVSIASPDRTQRATSGTDERWFIGYASQYLHHAEHGVAEGAEPLDLGVWVSPAPWSC